MRRPSRATTSSAPCREWDLDDLYPGTDSAELKRDLDWAKAEAKAFEADYKGKLDGADAGLVV